MIARGTLRFGTACGIPLLVNASWLVAFALAVGALGHELEAPSAWLRWVLAAATAIAFFGSVLAHELAHGVVALRLGVPVRSITLFVFGGLAALGAEPRRPRDELLIAAAGPLMSVAIGVVSLLLGSLAPAPFAEPFAWLGRVNVGLAVFNCLPGLPLDGGRIARAILWARRGDVHSATVTAARIGGGIAYAFLALGIWTAAIASFVSGMWMAFIGWFLLQAAQASQRDASLRGALEGLVARDVLTTDYPSVSASLDVATYVEGIVFPSGDRTHIVRRSTTPTGLITLERALSVPRARWATTSVTEVGLPLASVPTVRLDTSVIEVLGTVSDAPIVFVTDGYRLAGVIDRRRLHALVDTRLDVSRVTPWRPRVAAAAALGAAAIFVLAAAACDVRKPTTNAEAARLEVPAPAPAPASRPAVAPSAASPPLQCGTLRDVGESDVVRVDGTRIFYADEATGLSVVDLEDAERPRRVGASPFVGTPLALFVDAGMAWVVFVDWDSRALPHGGVSTVVRALDVKQQIRRLGEAALPGVARDVQRVGEVLYVLRDAGGYGTVSSFRVVGGALSVIAETRVEGAPVRLAASAAGLAVIGAGDGTIVTWIDLPFETPGAMRVHGAARVDGGFPVWERGAGRAVDADEDRRVRLLTCSSPACGPDDTALFHVVDFGRSVPELLATVPVTKRPGFPVTRFAGDLLFVAEPSSPGEAATTDLSVVRLQDPRRPKTVSHLSLRGSVRTLIAHEGRLVALGTVGSPATSVRLAVHDVDAREPTALRARGTVTFGRDWTWSVAEDVDRAVSFDPTTSLVAIPFTAWTGAEQRYETGTQLVAVGDGKPHLGATFAGDAWVERAVFLRGRLITIGPDGVRAIDYARPRGLQVQ